MPRFLHAALGQVEPTRSLGISPPLRRLPGRLVFFATLTVAMGLARASGAEASRPIREAIRVDAGATCLETGTLADHIQAWLGSDAIAADVSVEVEGSPDQPRIVRFRALRGNQVIATRRFDPGPANCENLNAAVGLAIAMALGASVTGELSRFMATPALAPGAPVPPEKRADRAWAFGASAMATVDVLPAVALGVETRIAWSFTSSLALRLGLIALVGMPGGFEGLNAHYETELFAARVDACAGADASRRFRVEGCAGFAGGALAARGHSFTVSQAAVARWMAIANGLEALANLGPDWSLDLAVGLILPLQRMSVVVRSPSGAAVRTQDLAPVGDFSSLGAIYRF